MTGSPGPEHLETEVTCTKLFLSVLRTAAYIVWCIDDNYKMYKYTKCCKIQRRVMAADAK